MCPRSPAGVRLYGLIRRPCRRDRKARPSACRSKPVPDPSRSQPKKGNPSASHYQNAFLHASPLPSVTTKRRGKNGVGNFMAWTVLFMRASSARPLQSACLPVRLAYVHTRSGGFEHISFRVTSNGKKDGSNKKKKEKKVAAMGSQLEARQETAKIAEPKTALLFFSSLPHRSGQLLSTAHRQHYPCPLRIFMGMGTLTIHMLHGNDIQMIVGDGASEPVHDRTSSSTRHPPPDAGG